MRRQRHNLKSAVRKKRQVLQHGVQFIVICSFENGVEVIS